MALPKPLREQAPAAPLTGAEAAEAFARFRRKKPATKARLLTERIARLVSAGRIGTEANPFAAMIADLAGAQIRAVWHPTAGFLNRLSAAQLDAIMAEIGGEGVPAGFAKLRKRDKLARLAAIFAEAPGAMPLSPEQKGRAAKWLPEGMVPVEADAEPMAAE